MTNSSSIASCPRLCESQHMWRLDRHDSIPWWTRWTPRGVVVSQCTCSGCPETSQAARDLLHKTVEESLWDNGQVTLMDIARRENLHFGPNYRMQELMAQRNAEILRTIKFFGPLPNSDTERRISRLNQRYASLIVHAARTYSDDGRVRTPGTEGGRRRRGFRGRGEDKDGRKTTIKIIIAAVVCSSVILAATIAASCWLHRAKASKVERFQGENAVVGRPVQEPNGMDGNIMRGAPVTLTAPTKSKSADSKKGDFSAPTLPAGEANFLI